ncbi:hypothetical protein TrVGV298_006436 [Trichoderma virens]|nr:hypothetical protein TrVGV298_006436 [Trichoderma virens]
MPSWMHWRESPPSYLKATKVPLVNQTFEDINAVHSHLFDRYVLTGQVIDARRLHHSHFYSAQLDFGHQSYLDKLSSNRHIILRSLERLEKRTADVLYQKEQWFAWVRQAQEDEEATRDKEQKKIKQEAALFKRHRDKLQARLEQARREEEQRSQDAYLEAAFRERMDMSADEWENDEAWDPIKDTDHDKRNQYINLIKHFLWMDAADIDNSQDAPLVESKAQAQAEEAAEDQQEEKGPKLSRKAKKKSKAKKSAVKPADHGTSGASPTDQSGQSRLVAMRQSEAKKTDSDQQMPDRNNIETEQEMRKRLSQGVDKKMDNAWGFHIVGSVQNPYETFKKTAPMTNDEIETAIKDIREIKLLLFCRLLLAQASMLPAALRASSVHEFLNDSEVFDSDLRDICLKLETPSLQQIRDACADFARRDDAEEAGGSEAIDDSGSDDEEAFRDKVGDHGRYMHLHTEEWFLNELVGQPRQEATSSTQRSRVTICGKKVWNHASEKAMSRDGWLQFSIIAKDCSFKHAIQLCRNWAEFSELNLLTLWQFFPASNWESWGSNKLIRQLLELQFFPYFIDLEAQRYRRRFKASGRGQLRRQHDVIETRNIIVGHMKRRDPVTRRFLQYLTMRTGELLVLVRDGKNGRVITAPPDAHLWTYRRKKGIGRASKNEWQNLLEVGPDYFDMTDSLREWRFGFDDFYDVYIWDLVPDASPLRMYNVIISELRKAWRFTQPLDMYAHMEPLLRTLTREKETMRTRKINPGEQVESLWDVVTGDDVEFCLYDARGTAVTWPPKDPNSSELANFHYLFYNKANVVEDEVLFPDGLAANRERHFREIRNAIDRFEHPMLPSRPRYFERGMTAILEGQDLETTLNQVMDSDEGSIWALPAIWESGLEKLLQGTLSAEQRQVLEKAGLGTIKESQLLADRLKKVDPMEQMERERSIEFKVAFHQADLEPGCTKKYIRIETVISTMLKLAPVKSADWVYYIAELMNWLDVHVADDDYYGDFASDPWSHGFIVQDMVQAFSAMALFFPEVGVVAHVTEFLKFEPLEQFRKSLLFDPRERNKTRPDRRTRTSFKFRDVKFWTEWNAVREQKQHFSDIFPFDWSVAIRPIIAKLYRTGIIAPAHLQNVPEIVAGVATAMTEPHRPDKLDLFISYYDPHNRFPTTFPHFAGPDNWPKILPHAEAFAKEHQNARFALLRIWTAPHFYPLMLGANIPGSEFSMHKTITKALAHAKEQFGDRVVVRGDLVLVMGEDAADLFKYCTAATFAIQTRPWLREIDLWKSFINVDLDLLKELDPVWLD